MLFYELPLTIPLLINFSDYHNDNNTPAIAVIANNSGVP